MGGLVVKKAYLLGHQEAEFQSVVERVCSIFFLATPHQGAAIAQTLARLMALVPGTRPFVDDLLPQSPMLQSINEDFPRICTGLQIMSFYETRHMNIGLNKVMIVEKTSAVMNLPNERRTLLDADHRNAAMYASRNESSFLAVRNALATVVTAQRDWSQSQRQTIAQEDQAALNSFLGVSDAPEDDLLTQELVQLPGSCEWLSNKVYYKSWRESLDSRFLWLRGRPGAGKSVLASHVINNDLRPAGIDCCFFFFQSGDKAKSTANLFLRSIAWQMAMLHPSVMTQIRELISDSKDTGIDRLDPNPVWRKVFLSSILKVRLNRPQFWVIDAMDECKGSADMIGFLARIQEQWPVSILVTSRDPPETHLGNTNTRLEISSHLISDDDSKQDIAAFLTQNMGSLTVSGSGQFHSAKNTASQITENSRGCFLWASLMCSELRRVTSEKEARKVLESIPSDMDSLYSRILTDMAEARFGKPLAKAFITWTMFAFRPLSTDELLQPIEMDVNDKIDDVQTAISKCCGNLIYVDEANKKVQLVHSTVREYLAGKDVQSEFAVSKRDGHRRLASICLEFLIQTDKSASKIRRLNSDAASISDAASQSVPPFTDYASTFVFLHLHHVHSTDEEILVLLSKFLSSTAFLRWIEYIGANGDLHTVYQAGKTIKSLLDRRAQHSPPVGLARGRKPLAMLDKWAEDLTHLVTKFSFWLRTSPQSIHHNIPAFCPTESAIRRQFSRPQRGITVQGLSNTSWDDCLTTISYAPGEKPIVLASGPGFFAVGMMNRAGDVKVYDDSIFQEICTLAHGEPVWRMNFAENGAWLATAGAKRVKLWSCATWTSPMDFGIPALCMALAFTDEDSILRVATKQNHLFEWSIEDENFLNDEPVDWMMEMEDEVQFRTPTSIAFGPVVGFMSVVYRGQNLVLWDYIDSRVADVYEKETGSVGTYGSRKLADGTTTVRSSVFSPAIDSHELAVTYTDGDLILYDTSDGSVIASAEGANAVVLAPSSDGRTLAGVDSAGNMTLFEFTTLRRLYRVQFDTDIPPKGLAFTSDSLRLIEIRGGQCQIWEPTVLYRTDAPEDENSDTVSVSTGPQEINFTTTRPVNITAMVCCQNSSAVFCGMQDGSVHAYDISGEPESQLLFVQTVGCPVDMLYVDEISSIIACGDLSGRTTARQYTNRRASQRHKMAWSTSDELLIDTRLPGQGHVRQILVSGPNSRMLVSTDSSDTLWPVPKQAQGDGWLKQSTEWASPPHWLPHPAKSDYLLHVGSTVLGLYTWSDLELVRSIQLAPTATFDQLVWFQSPLSFATISKAPGEQGQSGYTNIQLWNFSDIEDPDNSFVEPTGQLDKMSSEVDRIIGTFGSRLVVYTNDYWIASVDVGQSEESLVRHFFVPSDWISVAHNIVIGVGRSGEILFTRLAELAVIKRGLEITDSGAPFNPRRGSNQAQSSALSRRSSNNAAGNSTIASAVVPQRPGPSSAGAWPVR
jgi:WD40 repeat protein